MTADLNSGLTDSRDSRKCTHDWCQFVNGRCVGCGHSVEAYDAGECWGVVERD